MPEQKTTLETLSLSAEPTQHFWRPVSFKLAALHLKLMLGLGEVRVYVLDDLLRRLGKDCELCVYGPAKRRFLTNECCKCIERAGKLVHSIVPDPNYISNPEKLDKWLL